MLAWHSKEHALSCVPHGVRSFCNVWDSLARLCMPRRLRFDEDAGADDGTERGRQLLREEQARSLFRLLFHHPESSHILS
jgi:hypothetical protein